MSDITRSAPAELRSSSFDQIAAVDQSTLPPADHFDVPGCRLGFRHYRAATARRVLVLIHGSGCFGDLSHAMATQVAQADIAHVLTLDMRGHGISGGPRGHAVQHSGQLVADIALFIGHMRRVMNKPDFILGGHSAGGGVVLAFARSAHRRLVSAYVFLAPYLGLGSKLNRPHFGGWVRLRTLKLKAVTLANLCRIKQFNNTTVVDFNVKAAGDPRYVPSWSFNTLLAFGPGLWCEHAPRMSPRKPVLVLSLDSDDCFYSKFYGEAFRTIAPHAEVPHVGNGGHWDLLANARAISLLCDWISRTGSSSGQRGIRAAPQRQAA